MRRTRKVDPRELVGGTSGSRIQSVPLMHGPHRLGRCRLAHARYSGSERSSRRSEIGPDPCPRQYEPGMAPGPPIRHYRMGTTPAVGARCSERASVGVGQMALFRRKRTDGPDLVGTWRSTDSDDVMEFFPSGELHFRSPTGEDTTGIVMLTYQIEGDVIVTDQPSQPAEERTRFLLQGETLSLTAPDGTQTTWTRS